MYFVIADIKIIQAIKLTVQLIIAIIFRSYKAILNEEILKKEFFKWYIL